MQTLLMIAISAVACWIMYEAFRRVGNCSALICFGLLPIVLTPRWAVTNTFGWFEWAKLYSVLVGACWLVALRFPKRLHESGASGLNLLVGINILEAVALESIRAEFSSLMNAVSGVMLVVNLPKSPVVRTRIGCGIDVEFKAINRVWIIQYTLWNMAFLYINYPQIFGHHLAVLGVPLAIGMRNPNLWLQARVCVLAIDLILLATFWQALKPYLDTTELQHENLKSLLASIPLALWILLFIRGDGVSDLKTDGIDRGIRP